MKDIYRWGFIAFATGLTLALTAPCAALTRDFAVEVSALVQESPPRIDFSWVADASATEYRIFKKSLEDTVWIGPIAVLDGTATSFTDTDVAVGQAYEYSFRKSRGIIIDTLAVVSGTPLTFTIKDSWGDGICCDQSLGSYEVTGCGVVYASGGDFGASESTSFTVGTPEGPCDEIVIAITLDIFGEETTWHLRRSDTGDTLAQGGPYSSPRFGHILAGIRYPQPETWGAVLLLVDEPVASPLATELERLELDLIRDGYRVVRCDVPEGVPVPAVKALVVAECQADPAISTLLLFGNIAVPYSGDVRAAHANHFGAWPADLYYGELDGVWTDSIVSNTSADRPENHNVPGDGKFDQTYLPSDVDLQVGRVDLSRMPAFAEDEIELLRRYLDKDHAYRTGATTIRARGLIDDNVGEAFGGAYACTGWRNFTALVGRPATRARSWLPTLEANEYRFAYGCGGGSYTSCGGVATTGDFATRTMLTVFTMLMGSYFGDWDNTDNLLRAPLGSAGYPLTCCWAGKPAWHLHHMGLGYPIGYSTRLTQNNHTLYMIGYGGRQIHTALMGDPTLRMHVVRPPSGLVLNDLSPGGIGLTWRPSADSVAGYNVYSATGIRADFSRVNPAMIEDTTFVDESPLPGNNVYMVRAVKLETTASGTYLNLSPGVIDSIDVAAGIDPASECRFLKNWPNPFPATTSIIFHLPRPGRITLKIHDVTGRLVRAAEVGWLEAGTNNFEWDGRDGHGHSVASGVYFLTLTADRTTLSTKMIRVE
jgi:hypothetical protein